MPDRDVGDDSGRSTDRLLGELIAEIRALKHAENNTAANVAAIGRQVASIPQLVEQVKEIREEQEKHHFRLAVLEADQHRREGAIGLVEWVSRHWPFTLIVAALAAWVGWANGKIDP
jgi:hypothetical protein